MVTTEIFIGILGILFGGLGLCMVTGCLVAGENPGGLVLFIPFSAILPRDPVRAPVPAEW